MTSLHPSSPTEVDPVSEPGPEPTQAADRPDAADVFDDQPHAVRAAVAGLARVLSATAGSESGGLRARAAAHIGSTPDSLAVVTAELPVTAVPLVSHAVGELLRARPDLRVAGRGGSGSPGFTLVTLDVDEQVADPANVTVFLDGSDVEDAPYGPEPRGVLLCGQDEMDDRVLSLHVHRRDAVAAQSWLTRFVARARGPANFFRGKTLLASMDRGEVRLQIIAPLRGDRSALVFPPDIWRELDTSIEGLRRHGDVLLRAGLGANRGILIAGPPGVGKTALCRTLGAELAGERTIVTLDPALYPSLWGDVYDAVADRGPALVILDDLDLAVGDRRSGSPGRGLAALLTALDGTSGAGAVLTIATTNDAAALDPAAIRAGRFDVVLRIDVPGMAAAADILRGHLDRLIGVSRADRPADGVSAEDGPEVDVQRVARLSAVATMSGADLREVVRRAVLEHGPALRTEHLLDIVHTGRWKPELPTGAFL
jgi:transitional endoplasmic reticulum ATPase